MINYEAGTPQIGCRIIISAHMTLTWVSILLVLTNAFEM